ncbi:hypothetical protein ACFWUW_02600 [Streptomyces sp. NPDC058655]|uniref:hypothetical protein n=1 Tax=unclassified Streptomyces TaxID=2593676 RepID=UPI00365ECD7C
MTTAEHLGTIDRLRRREFPTEPVRSGGQSSGPGYHLVEIGRTDDFWDDGGSGRIEAIDQINAEYTALTEALTGRWGRAQVFGVDSLKIRRAEGEEIPEPWDRVSAATDHVHVWEVEGLWLVAYAAHGAGGDPYVLVAGVTQVDPP